MQWNHTVLGSKKTQDRRSCRLSDKQHFKNFQYQLQCDNRTQKPNSAVAGAFCNHCVKNSAIISVYSQLLLGYSLPSIGFSSTKTNCQINSHRSLPALLQEGATTSFSRATVLFLQQEEPSLCFHRIRNFCTGSIILYSAFFLQKLQCATRSAKSFAIQTNISSNPFEFLEQYFMCRKQILLELLLLGIYLFCA